MFRNRRDEFPLPGSGSDGVPVWAVLAATPAFVVGGAFIPFNLGCSVFVVPVLMVVSMCVVSPLLHFVRVRRFEAEVDGGASFVDSDWTYERESVVRTPARRRIPPAFAGCWLMWWCAIGSGAGASALLGGPSVLGLSLGPGALVAAIVTRHFLAPGVQVRFDRFPYWTGERVTLWIATTPGSPLWTDVGVLLRCLVRPEGGAGWQSAEVVWTSAVFLDPDGTPGPDEFVPVTFELPEPHRVLGTDRHARRPVHWEVVNRGRWWGSVSEAIPVPIYDAPEGERGPSS